MFTNKTVESAKFTTDHFRWLRINVPNHTTNFSNLTKKLFFLEGI